MPSANGVTIEIRIPGLTEESAVALRKAIQMLLNVLPSAEFKVSYSAGLKP